MIKYDIKNITSFILLKVLFYFSFLFLYNVYTLLIYVYSDAGIKFSKKSYIQVMIENKKKCFKFLTLNDFIVMFIINSWTMIIFKH